MLLLLISFLSLSVQAQNSMPLPAGVSVIEGTALTLPNQDLHIIDAYAKEAVIFGIGESGHASLTYLETELRLVQYLVLHFGYRKLMMEMLTDDRALNNYVLHHQGNLRQAMYLNSWKADTQPYVDLYEWLANYNQQHPSDPVTITAVDTQKPWEDSASIQTFLNSINPTLTTQYWGPISVNCTGAGNANQIEWAYSHNSYTTTGKIPDSEKDACMNALAQFEAFLKSKKSTLIASKGSLAFHTAWYATKGIESSEMHLYYLNLDPLKSAAVREAAFGASVLWNLSQAEAHPKKAILLAHNIHLSKTVLLPASTSEFNGSISVGSQLYQTLRNQYRTFAQSGMNIKGFQMGRQAQAEIFPVPTAANSIDVTLNSLAQAHLFLDTHAAGKDNGWLSRTAGGLWFMHEEATAINGRLTPLYSKSVPSFDGVFFH